MTHERESDGPFEPDAPLFRARRDSITMGAWVTTEVLRDLNDGIVPQWERIAASLRTKNGYRGSTHAMRRWVESEFRKRRVSTAT